MARAIASIADGHVVTVHLLAQAGAASTTTAPAETTTTVQDPSPIKISGAELGWYAGSFLVLLVLVRLWLYPRVKRTMDARADYVQGNLAEAERTRAGAQSELAEYQAEIAKVRAEGQQRVDVVRQQLERERSDAMAQASTRIAAQRAAAAAETQAAREAASGQVAEAVRQVTTVAAARALGAAPDPSLVRAAVDQAMNGDPR